MKTTYDLMKKMRKHNAKIYTVSALLILAVIAVISPLAALSVFLTIIIFAPFLWWLIEITKGFEDLREREKAIEVRRKALGLIDKN